MVSLGHNELIVRHSQRHFSCTISSRSPLRNDRCGYWAPPQPAPTLPHPTTPNPTTTTTTTTPTPSPPDDGAIIDVNGTGVPFTPMITPSSSTPKLPFLILLHVQKNAIITNGHTKQNIYVLVWLSLAGTPIHGIYTTDTSNGIMLWKRVKWKNININVKCWNVRVRLGLPSTDVP